MGKSMVQRQAEGLLYCLFCGNYWKKRLYNPKVCPRCNSDTWFKRHPEGAVREWKLKHGIL